MQFRGALLAFLAVFALTARAQEGAPYALARVGHEVDPRERAYFLLFPTLDAQDTVRVFHAGVDSVRISTGSDDLVVSAERVRVLDQALSEYESLFSGADVPFETLAIAGLIRWRLPFEAHEAVVVTRRDGPEVRGELLDADTSGLVLATGPLPFRSFRSPDGLVWVPADEVVRVRRPGFLSTLDVRPGGDPDRYTTEALPHLRRSATFSRGLSPELLEWQRPQPEPSDVADADRSFDNVPLSRWQVSVHWGLGRLGAGTTATDAFSIAPRIEEDWGGWTLGGRLRVGYNVTAALGLEATGLYQATEEMEGVALDLRRYSAYAVSLTASYALVSPRLLRPALVVRGGPSLVRSVATSALEYYSPRQTLTGVGEFEAASTRAGATFGAEVGVRLSRGASLAVGYDWAVYPSVQEAEIVLRDTRVGAALKEVEAREFNLLVRGVEIGLIVHFSEW